MSEYKRVFAAKVLARRWTHGVIVLTLVVTPALAIGDMISPPTLGSGPLHRIGIEILFEAAAAVAVGGAALHALVKRRWKWRDQMSEGQSRRFAWKLENAWPEVEKAWHDLPDDVQSKSIRSIDAFRDAMADLLCERQSLCKRLKGIPFELLCETAIERLDLKLSDGWGPDCGDVDSSGNGGQDGRVAMRTVCFCCGVYMSEEDSRDWKERGGAWKLLMRRKQKQRARRRMAVFVVALVVAVIAAWLAGRYF